MSKRRRRARRRQSEDVTPPAAQTPGLGGLEWAIVGALCFFGICSFAVLYLVAAHMRPRLPDGAVLRDAPSLVAAMHALLMAVPLTWFGLWAWHRVEARAGARRAGLEPRSLRLQIVVAVCHLSALAGCVVVGREFLNDAATYAYIDGDSIGWRLGFDEVERRRPLADAVEVRTYETPGYRRRRSPKVEVRFRDGTSFRSAKVPAGWEDRGCFAGQVARAAGLRVIDDGYRPRR